MLISIGGEFGFDSAGVEPMSKHFTIRLGTLKLPSASMNEHKTDTVITSKKVGPQILKVHKVCCAYKRTPCLVPSIAVTVECSEQVFVSRADA